MFIRPYCETDVQAVVSLWHRCGLTRPWNDPYKDIDRKLAVQRDLFLVGELDGDIIGTVMAGYEGHRGWINYLAVDPVQQRQGYGRELMAAAEQRLRALGCPKINLQVRCDNAAARQFYERLGFVEDRVLSFGKRLANDAESSELDCHH